VARATWGTSPWCAQERDEFGTETLVRGGGIGDFTKETVTVSGLNVSFTNQHYTGGACTVRAVPVDGPVTGSIVVGSAVTSSLGGTAVTAYPDDWHGSNGSSSPRCIAGRRSSEPFSMGPSERRRPCSRSRWC
jgi:hypothetical protein